MLCTLLLVLQVGAQTQAAPPRDAVAPTIAPTSISGRVTEQGSGQPLPRAVVTLSMSDRSRYFEAVADDEGRYEFTDLSAGDFVIWAGPPELHATHLPQVFGEPEPMDSFVFPRANLRLQPGEGRTGVDMALARALAIEGRIVDPWDEPMAGVDVLLTRMNGSPLSTRVNSDDRGEFRLFGIAPGRYRVCAAPSNRFADAPSDDAGRLVRTCHPGSVSESGANDVVLTSRDATGIDIRMQRSRAYSLSGMVRDALGNPAADAFVGAYSLDDRVSASARTSGGEFVVRGLTPGRYLVTAAAGFSPMPEQWTGGREPEMGFVQVEVDGDLSGLTIALAKAHKLSGRVIFNGLPAPPVKQLRLVVQTRPASEMNRVIPSRPPFSPVDENLNFTLTGLFRVPLAVGIHGVPDGWALEAVRYDGRDITDIATDFGAPADSRALEIVLTNRVARPVVKVTNEQGRPVTSYRVVVLPANPARWKSASWSTGEEPALDGTAKVGPLVPGNYLIAALQPSEMMILLTAGATGIERVAGIATRLTLTEGDDRTFELRIATLPPEIR